MRKGILAWEIHNPVERYVDKYVDSLAKGRNITVKMRIAQTLSMEKMPYYHIDE